MIELSRRHGHWDPRYGPSDGRCSPDSEERGLVSMMRMSGYPDEDELAVQIQEHVTDDGVPPIDIWENEGGSYSDEPELTPDRVSREQPPAGLDWYAFLTVYFPGRRRHDLEALKAYEAYRSSPRLMRGSGPYRQ
jgi:hypothetical protein